jgi:DNA-binding NarL/FixJ family response regulator
MKLRIAVVLLQCDREIERSLASALSHSFPFVHQVDSVSELRNRIGKHPGGVAILDMERASFSDVERLSHDFPAASIVCTHRCADEEMWTAALNAGARDVYSSADIPGIVGAALRSCANVHSAAA